MLRGWEEGGKKILGDGHEEGKKMRGGWKEVVTTWKEDVRRMHGRSERTGS